MKIIKKDWMSFLRRKVVNDYKIDLDQTTPDSFTYAFSYDEEGRITKVIDLDEYKDEDEYEYDAWGLPIWDDDEDDGIMAEYSYKDIRGEYTEIRGYCKSGYGYIFEDFSCFDNREGYWRKTVDYEGRLMNLKAGKDYTEYIYDDEKRLIEKKYKKGGRTVLEYNDTGKIIKEVFYPKEGEPYPYWFYDYDKNGNLIAKSRASHIDHSKIYKTIHYKYDKQGRCIEESQFHNPEITTYEYSFDGKLIYKTYSQPGLSYYDKAYSYDVKGRLISTFCLGEEVVVSTTYEYDDTMLLEMTIKTWYI